MLEGTHSRVLDRSKGFISITNDETLYHAVRMPRLFDHKSAAQRKAVLQEETTALKKPCITIRENKERPITIEIATNVLAGTPRVGILRGYRNSLEKKAHAAVPLMWDGRASERIWEV